VNFNGGCPKTFKFNKLLCYNNEGESKYTFTCEEIQNQYYAPILLKWHLFFNLNDCL